MASVFVVCVGVPASAETQEEIGGYSKTEFVDRAVASGVERSYAAAAWGDVEAMTRIPVANGFDRSLPDDSARGVTFTAWCERWSKNFFGQILYRYRMTKSWTVGNGVISNPIVVPSNEASNGWYFDGVVDTQDVFAGNEHLSYRAVKFSSQFPGPTSESAWVQIISYPSADFDCSYGG